ncbi:MAG: thioredoxin family protein [Candidatus Omnitrophica bacterium]|nr:thioredoxin family protein [Candidatus Omnitrophota bacterium]
MKKLTALLGALVLAAVIGTGLAQAAVQNGAMAPDFTLKDSNGNTHSLSDFKGKYVVLEWVNFDCPFVKKHYVPGNMQALQKDLTAKGVVWLSINSSAPGKQGSYSPSEVNQIMENSSAMPTAYLFDSDGKVGKEYGAKTTPHMYVVNPEGMLAYQGAIDSIPSFDSADIPKARNYVTTAINNLMSGEPVADAATTPYGCSVKY